MSRHAYDAPVARTPGQRGEFGAWLESERKRRYRTQADALRAFEKVAGLKIAPSEYAQWESGSRVPREGNPKVARLFEFFGSRPEEFVPPEPSDLAALVAALHRQAAAQEEANRLMRDELAELRDRVTELVQGTAAEVQSLNRRLTVLEDRVPAPRPSGRASRGSSAHSGESPVAREAVGRGR